MINNIKQIIPNIAQLLDESVSRTVFIHITRKKVPTGSILSVIRAFAMSRLNFTSVLPGDNNNALS